MNVVAQAVQSESFVQAVFMLLITALVTGLLVPRVKAKLDHDNYERQKRLENELARQTKIHEDRVKLLDELETLLWEYQFLALEPSYYKLRGNAAGFQRTFQEYDEKAPKLLATIGARISKLGRLASAEVHQAFQNLFHRRLIASDGALISLAESEDTSTRAWEQHHDKVYKELGADIEALLLLLAHDFGFAAGRPERTVSESTSR